MDTSTNSRGVGSRGAPSGDADPRSAPRLHTQFNSCAFGSSSGRPWRSRVSQNFFNILVADLLRGVREDREYNWTLWRHVLHQLLVYLFVDAVLYWAHVRQHHGSFQAVSQSALVRGGGFGYEQGALYGGGIDLDVQPVRDDS